MEKVKVYHTNPEGIVTIKFHDQPAAEQVTAGLLGQERLTEVGSCFMLTRRLNAVNRRQSASETLQSAADKGVAFGILQCIAVMEGRFFGGRQIKAALWDGIQQYHVKPTKKSKEETEAEQQARLERFAAEIEAQEAPTLELPVPLAEPV